MRVETEGIRSQMVGLIAAALEPGVFGTIVSNEVLASLGELLQEPLVFRATPELFCQDLYEYFDIDQLETMAEPTSIESGRKATLAAPKAR